MEVGQGLGRLRTGPYRCMCNRLLARRPFLVPRFGLGPPGVWPERAGGVGGRVGVGMEVGWVWRRRRAPGQGSVPRPRDVRRLFVARRHYGDICPCVIDWVSIIIGILHVCPRLSAGCHGWWQVVPLRSDQDIPGRVMDGWISYCVGLSSTLLFTSTGGLGGVVAQSLGQCGSGVSNR